MTAATLVSTTSRHRVRKRYVETQAGEVHLRQCGEGIPIVLLPLLPVGTAMFEDLMPVLAARGYACFAFDPMGYGRSDRRCGTWFVEDFTENLAEAFRALDLRPKAILGGHFTSLLAVDISLRFPELVEKLILDGVPTWSDDERAERWARNAGSAPLEMDGGTLQRRWKMVTSVLLTADPQAELNPTTASAFLEAYTAFLMLDHKPGPEAAFFAYPTTTRLAAVTHPTLVVSSATDTLRNYHEAAVSLIPTAREHVFRSVNPMYHMTRPCPAEALRQYADVVHRFVQDRPADSPSAA